MLDATIPDDLVLIAAAESIWEFPYRDYQAKNSSTVERI
jgi:hypothetical protein